MKMRRCALIFLWILSWPATVAIAQVSIGIGLPGVNIGINFPLYPDLVQVPGYPVYYAPRINSNYFFYDGMYWVYQGDNWYASSWYNGPWGLVRPEIVPLFVLRIPVRYYRNPPAYFRGWRPDTPPRWGEHWGKGWEQQRSGWDRWNRGSAPAPAPLPVYQRQYSGDRYPRVDQQPALRSQNYRYQPRDAVVQQHYQDQERAAQKAPAPSQRGQQEAPQEKGRGPQQAPAQREQQAPVQREQPAPKSSQEDKPRGKGTSQESRPEQKQAPARGQDKGQDRDREKGEERGQERSR